jgi:L-ribulose-5-phosphate 3-epimerase
VASFSNKIGIMQGRLRPESLDRLQVFPVSNWAKEPELARSLGFQCFELLYDQEYKLRQLLNSTSSRSQLGLFCGSEGKNERIKTTSVCLDFLTQVSFWPKETSTIFLSELCTAIADFKDSNVSILVVPFCGLNDVITPSDLAEVLSFIQSNRLDQLACESGLSLALELDLPAAIVVKEFNKFEFSNVGICLDLGNTRAAGLLPEEEILLLSNLIIHLHLKDRSVGGPNVMFGDGQVDFSACFKSLREIDYRGQCVMESRYFSDPTFEASSNLKYIKKVSS